MLASAPSSPPPPQQQPQPPSRRKATKIGWPNVMGCFGSAAAKTDHDDAKKGKETNKKINQQLQKDKQVYRATHRLLLLGEWGYFFKKFKIFSRVLHFTLFGRTPLVRLIPGAYPLLYSSTNNHPSILVFGGCLPSAYSSFTGFGHCQNLNESFSS